MKVALVLASSTGGVGAHVRALATGLHDAGVEVTVVGPAATESLFGFSQVGAHFVATAGRFDVRTLVDVAGGGVDVVHAHGLRAGALAATGRWLSRWRRPTGTTSRRWGRRPSWPRPPERPALIVTWHNAVLDDEHQRVARRVLAAGERVVARAADVTLAASADLADRARALGARDVRVSPVALKAITPDRDRADVRRELGVPEHRTLVLTVARLHPQKALDVLIDAALGWPDATVVVAGDGPLTAVLQERIDRMGAPVQLLGRRTDVANLLAAADVAVLPSRWEARSLFAQEALQAGVPLVATAVGGLPELVGEGAVLVPPGDVGALRSAVAELLADADVRAELTANGRTQAATWPTAAATTAAVLDVYRELTDDR